MDLLPIAYRHEDREFTGYLADGSNGRPAAGILIAHEGGGLSRHTKERARRLGELGYVAFALDMYGEEDPTLERAKELGQALRSDGAALRGRVRAAFDLLVALPEVDRSKLAAIGYCMGGAAVIELARAGAPLACLVGFHSGFLPGTPAENRAIRARLLLCHGADDPVVSPALCHAFTAEMSAAGVDWQLHLYGGVGHSFTNPDIDAWNLPGFRHHPTAEEGEFWSLAFPLPLKRQPTNSVRDWSPASAERVPLSAAEQAPSASATPNMSRNRTFFLLIAVMAPLPAAPYRPRTRSHLPDPSFSMMPSRRENCVNCYSGGGCAMPPRGLGVLWRGGA
jgi:dienelactone hydrolase